MQIDFDPMRISYEKLLEMFWHSHNPEMRPWTRQYASIIFYHNDEQKRAAEETKFHTEETSRKVKLYTEIVPYTEFYLAETYHQKYWLQQNAELMQEFRWMYPNLKDIINSTAAARVNGLVAGYGSFDGMTEELGSYGLSPEGNRILMELVRRIKSRLERVSETT